MPPKIVQVQNVELINIVNQNVILAGLLVTKAAILKDDCLERSFFLNEDIIYLPNDSKDKMSPSDPRDRIKSPFIANNVNTIVITTNKKAVEVYNMLISVIDECKSTVSKKVIIVTKEAMVEKKSSNLSFTVLEKINITPECITPNGIKNLCSKKILLQGHQTSLHDMLGCAETPMLSTKAKSIIDGLIKDEKYFEGFIKEELSIGQHHSWGETQNYHVERMLVSSKLIPDQMKKLKDNKILFLFVGCSERTVKETIPKNYTVAGCNKIVPKVDCFVIPESEDLDPFLQQLQTSEYAKWKQVFLGIVQIHEKNIIVWNQSSDVIDCDEAINFSETKPLDELTFGKIVILTDLPGMGKSTTMTQVCASYKSKHGNCWVVRLDLNDLSPILCKHNNEHYENVNSAVDFLTEKILVTKQFFNQNSKVKIQRDLFEYACLNQGNVFLGLDGLDEVCPFYKEFVVSWIKTLSKSKITKIFITSRPNMRSELCSIFNPFILTLKQFSKDNQLSFLTDFWMEELSLKDSKDLELVTKYAETAIDMMKKCIQDKCLTFTGIPLLTKLIAEVMQDQKECPEKPWIGCKQYVERGETNTPRMPRFDLNYLYREFVKKKFDIYYINKFKGTSSNAMLEKNGKYEKFLEHHRIISLRLIFGEKDFFMLFSDRSKLESIIKEVNDYKDQYGIIVKMNEGNPVFVHKTFAEYFVSDYIMNEDQFDKKMVHFIHNRILLDDEFFIIRSFMDMQEKSFVDKYLPFEYINDVWTLKKHTVSPIALYNYKHEKSQEIFDKTFLEGHSNILSALISFCKNKNECKMVTFKLAKKFLNRAAIVLEDHGDMLRLLTKISSKEHIIKFNAESEDLYNIISVLFDSDINKKICGDGLVSKRTRGKVKKISNSSENVKPNIFRWCLSPVDEGGGGLSIVSTFDNDKTETLFHSMCNYACTTDYMSIVIDYENLEEVINMKNSFGNTPMHYLAERGYSAMVEMILDKAKEKGFRVDLSAVNNIQQSPTDIAKLRSESGVRRSSEYGKIYNMLRYWQ